MRFLPYLVASSLLVVACAATNDDSNSSSEDLSADSRHKKTDAGTSGSADGGTSVGDGGADGTPTRQQCTSSFGSGLSSGAFGRLDGRLVAIVPAGSTKSCNGDSGHDHLQIEMNGSIYDVAVNVEGIYYTTKNAPLVGGAWSEGWHANATLDYPTDLDLHSSDFTQSNQDTLATDVANELATANHVSVFATKYSTGGIHLVHRSKAQGQTDGAVIINPLSDSPTYLVFHFSDQSF